MSSYSLAGMPLLDYLLPFLSRLQVWLFHPYHDEYLSRMIVFLLFLLQMKRYRKQEKSQFTNQSFEQQGWQNPKSFCSRVSLVLEWESKPQLLSFFFRLDLEGRKKKIRSWENLGSLWTQTKLHFIVVRIFLAPLGFVFLLTFWFFPFLLFFKD